MSDHHRHFILHKPYGYLSQFIVNGKQKKRNKLMGELFNFPKSTMAIGRLDRNSEGLLFLTTDGKVSYQVLSTKYEKEYFVQVDGMINEKDIEQLQKGVLITVDGEKYFTKSCVARIIESPKNQFPIDIRKERDARHGPKSWLSIALTEGKYRQVRKMTAAIGKPTLRLIRVRIGAYYLKTAPGEVIEVSSLL